MAFFTALFSVLGSHIATLIAGGLVLGSAYVFLSPNGREVMKGIRNHLTSNASNNPKIAAGIFDEKIKEDMKIKKQVVELSEKTHGALAEMCEKEEKARFELQDYSKKAKRLELNGEHEKAKRMADEAKRAMIRMNAASEKIPGLKAKADAIMGRLDEIETEIADLKERKSIVIDNIKTGKLEKDISEELANLKISTLDQVIEGIEDYSNQTKYTAIGARMVYENSDQKKLKDAIEAADYIDTEDFLKQIMEDNNY